MSITFHPEHPTVPRPDCDYADENDHIWDAYFTLKASVDGEFNVSNRNGGFILGEILQVEGAEPYGSHAADLVLLAVSAYRAKRGVLETVTTEYGQIIDADGVRPQLTHIDCGRDEEQVQGYLDRLTRLAEICQKRGETVTWS